MLGKIKEYFIRLFWNRLDNNITNLNIDQITKYRLFDIIHKIDRLYFFKNTLFNHLLFNGIN